MPPTARSRQVRNRSGETHSIQRDAFGRIFIKNGPYGRPRTYVKPPFDTTLTYPDEAVYLTDAARQLQVPGCYDLAPENGGSSGDVTAFHPDQKSWAPIKKHRPNILFQYEKAGHQDPKHNVGFIFDREGRVILDDDNRQVHFFEVLPITISTKVEGWRLEAWMRLDSRITYSDIRARMPKLFHPGSKKDARPSPNTLEMRRFRARRTYRCLSWKPTGKVTAFDTLLSLEMTSKMRTENSTRQLEDLSRNEYQALENALPLQSNNDIESQTKAKTQRATVTVRGFIFYKKGAKNVKACPLPSTQNDLFMQNTRPDASLWNLGELGEIKSNGHPSGGLGVRHTHALLDAAEPRREVSHHEPAFGAFSGPFLASHELDWSDPNFNRSGSQHTTPRQFGEICSHAGITNAVDASDPRRGDFHPLWPSFHYPQCAYSPNQAQGLGANGLGISSPPGFHESASFHNQDTRSMMESLVGSEFSPNRSLNASEDPTNACFFVDDPALFPTSLNVQPLPRSDMNMDEVLNGQVNMRPTSMQEDIPIENTALQDHLCAPIVPGCHDSIQQIPGHDACPAIDPQLFSQDPGQIDWSIEMTFPNERLF